MGHKWLVLLGAVTLVAVARPSLAQQWDDGLHTAAAGGLRAFDPNPDYSSQVAHSCYIPTWRAHGEFLLLRPGSDKVSYAVPIDGAIAPPDGVPPVQVGRESVLDPGYNAGFRVGFDRALTDRTSLGLVYSHFESRTSDQVTVEAPGVLRSLINHPGTVAAPTDFLDASGRYGIDFRMADIEFRRHLSCGPQHLVSGLVGVRYAHLDQRLASEFTDGIAIETVDSRINFDGGGIRFGLEGERHSARSGFLAYGKTGASFLAGEFSSSYVQADSFRDVVVDTGWREDRVVTILDVELGVGWTSADGGLRLTAGYMFSGWLNTLTTGELIQAVQTNDSVSVHDTLTFDGLAVRGELRF